MDFSAREREKHSNYTCLLHVVLTTVLVFFLFVKAVQKEENEDSGVAISMGDTGKCGITE